MNYKKLDQRDHILLRPDTYIGSVIPISESRYVVDDIDNINNTKIVSKEIKYTPGFLKIFDEALVNAMDHVVRTGKVKYIKINFNRDLGYIEIENDGPGIPIEISKENKCYIPEMIFFHYLSGSNFDDSEDRLTGGRNGIGIKANVTFSKKFELETHDGKKSYLQIATDNLKTISKPIIDKSLKKMTNIKFYPDFARFGMDGFDNDSLSILYKRVYDASVYCGSSVKIYLNNTLINIKNLSDYSKMHVEDGKSVFYEKLKNGWEICVSSSQYQFESISIVNGINTYGGGTHINWASSTLSKMIAEKFSKKLKIGWGEVKNNLFLFMVCKLPNPTFNSQTKEILTNYISKDIIGDSEFSEKFIKAIMQSDIVKNILDKIAIKEKMELNKIQNQKKLKIEKLVDANSNKRNLCECFIFEGDSAGQPMRRFRDASTQGFFCLRGKFINVSELSGRKVVENEEAFNLMKSLGLKWGVKAEKSDIRFDKIIIATDADVDGDSITGLLLNFFANWPELFEMGVIYKCLTPLLILEDKKKKTEIPFYRMEDYNNFCKSNDISKYNIHYKKGIGSLEEHQFESIVKSPVLVKYTLDDISIKKLRVWFGSDSDLRKLELVK